MLDRGRKVASVSYEDHKKDIWDETFRHAGYYSQPGIDVQRLRAMGRSRRIVSASDEDKTKSARPGAF